MQQNSSFSEIKYLLGREEIGSMVNVGTAGDFRCIAVVLNKTVYVIGKFGFMKRHARNSKSSEYFVNIGSHLRVFGASQIYL